VPEQDSRLVDLRIRFASARIDPYLSLVPTIASRVLVAPGACVVGDVRIGADASIWYGSVLRGDIAHVAVGERTNIQDAAVLHVGQDVPCVVGSDVVVGHRAVLHACRVEDGCLIGVQATVLDGAVIGAESVVGAAALVTPRTVIPPGSLVLGAPGRVVRSLTNEEIAAVRDNAKRYVALKDAYLAGAP
jgi:carbonic anhydrase/acetyltransferase-like protein (isoleucine patch superfamily)